MKDYYFIFGYCSCRAYNEHEYDGKTGDRYELVAQSIVDGFGHIYHADASDPDALLRIIEDYDGCDGYVNISKEEWEKIKSIIPYPKVLNL